MLCSQVCHATALKCVALQLSRTWHTRGRLIRRCRGGRCYLRCLVCVQYSKSHSPRQHRNVVCLLTLKGNEMDPICVICLTHLLPGSPTLRSYPSPGELQREELSYVAIILFLPCTCNMIWYLGNIIAAKGKVALLVRYLSQTCVYAQHNVILGCAAQWPQRPRTYSMT